MQAVAKTSWTNYRQKGYIKYANCFTASFVRNVREPSKDLCIYNNMLKCDYARERTTRNRAQR